MPRALLLGVYLAAASSPLEAEETDLQGVYFVDAAASDDIEAAIAKGTADMNFAIRSLARSRTAKTNPRYQRIEIRRSDAAVSVKYDARAPLKIPDGGSISWIREDGSAYKVSAQWSNSQLVMHFNSDTGNRTNTLVLQPDGRTLKFNVTLTSSYLPAPIVYTLIYRR